MSYVPLLPRKAIIIPALYSVHYFEYPSSFSYSGESHDFWELLYVDKGEIHVTAGDSQLLLPQGSMIFHPPGQFHALRAGETAPDLVVVSFSCDSPEMNLLNNRIIRIDSNEKKLLGRIIEESAAAFSTPLGDPWTKELKRRPGASFGAEQLAAAALSELLIRLIRQSLSNRAQMPEQAVEASAINEVIGYLESHISENMTVEEIAKDLLIGRSRLQKMFHQQTGGGIMEYFNRMKIKAAQRMIREERMNYTQIAADLGFQSVHYFSRRFRKYTGMSPSEYARSVKLLCLR